LNRPVRNALFLLGGEAGARIFGFLVSAYLARVLGVAGFGQVGFALAVFAYATMATKFGLLTVGVKDVAQNRDSVAELTGSVITLRLLLGLLSAAVMVVLGLVLRKGATVRGLLLIFSVGVIFQCFLLEWVFTAVERTNYISIARTTTSAVYFGLALALVRAPEDIMMVPLAFVAATASGAAVLLIAYVHLYGRPVLCFDLAVIRGLARRAWPIGIASLLTQVHTNAGIVALSLMKGDQAAGEYTAAHRIVFFVLMLDRIFQTVFFPVVSRYAKKRPDRLGWLTGAALRMILAVGVPVCVSLLLLSSQAIGFVFGARYSAAVPLLATLSWFVLLSLLTSLAGYSLLAAGQERRFARNTTMGVSFSLCAAILGVALWGTRGAATGMVIGEAALFLLMGYDLLRIAPPSVNWRTTMPVIASLPLALVLLLLRGWSWPVAAILGTSVYVVLLFLSKGVTLSDFGLLRGND
jgi:O-antigen/teichoic acid export membrane protein